MHYAPGSYTNPHPHPRVANRGRQNVGRIINIGVFDAKSNVEGRRISPHNDKYGSVSPQICENVCFYV